MKKECEAAVNPGAGWMGHTLTCDRGATIEIVPGVWVCKQHAKKAERDGGFLTKDEYVRLSKDQKQE